MSPLLTGIIIISEQKGQFERPSLFVWELGREGVRNVDRE